MHIYIHTQRIHAHITTFKATKDIAAGQEIFVRYGGADWFDSKDVQYVGVGYAHTMWRPDLHALPCPQAITHTTESDGRHSFAVADTMPPDAVLEVSLCVEVSVVVVDQFPYLWDYVLIGETDRVRARVRVSVRRIGLGLGLVYW